MFIACLSIGSNYKCIIVMDTNLAVNIPKPGGSVILVLLFQLKISTKAMTRKPSCMVKQKRAP